MKKSRTSSFFKKTRSKLVSEDGTFQLSVAKTHNQESGNTAISNHIYGNNIRNISPCLEFKTAITTVFGVTPKPQKRSFVNFTGFLQSLLHPPYIASSFTNCKITPKDIKCPLPTKVFDALF